MMQGFLDGPHAKRSVRPGAAENNRKPITQPLGDRAKKEIDRQPLPARLVKFGRRQLVIHDLESAVGRNDVDSVRLQGRFVGDLHHRHLGAGRDDR